MKLRQQYQSYLIRLWQDQPDSPWHASLQNTAGGQLQGFASPADAWDYLVSAMARSEQAGSPAEDNGQSGSTMGTDVEI